MRYEDGRKAYTFSTNDVMPAKREPNMVDLSMPALNCDVVHT